jgi:hypothetical protein
MDTILRSYKVDILTINHSTYNIIYLRDTIWDSATARKHQDHTKATQTNTIRKEGP